MLQAGFARVDMTPPLGTPLAGYYEARYAEAKGKRVLVSSDAHRLEAINEPANSFSLDLPESPSHEEIRSAILRFLQE